MYNQNNFKSEQQHLDSEQRLFRVMDKVENASTKIFAVALVAILVVGCIQEIVAKFS